jgi:hypothetical protein
MAANRHAGAVRSYLDYLCESPKPAEATPWVDWAKFTLGATAMVGLSLGAGACGGEASDGEGSGGGGVAGQPAGGTGAVATGGVRTGGAANVGGQPSGGTINTGGVMYGMPGGSPAGGRPAGGNSPLGGIWTLYGLPTGGVQVGGQPARTGGTTGIIGGAGADLYGIFVGGTGG